MHVSRQKLITTGLLAALLLAGVAAFALADAPIIYHFQQFLWPESVEGTGPHPGNPILTGIFKLQDKDTPAAESIGAYNTAIQFTAADFYRAKTDELLTCEALWLVSNYPPDITGPAVNGVSPAARQATLWHFLDGFDLTAGPLDAYNQLVAAAAAEGPALCAQTLLDFQLIVSSSTVQVVTDPAHAGQTFDLFADDATTPFATVTAAADGQSEVVGRPSGSQKISAATIAFQKIASMLVAVDDIGNPLPNRQKLVTPGMGLVKIVKLFEEETAVSLVSFTVATSPGRAVLIWETATELDNAGFNLYRAASPDGPWQQLNAALLPATGDPVTGASYTFTDTPPPGNYVYRLEDVDLTGQITQHPVVSVQISSALRLPQFRPALPEF